MAEKVGCREFEIELAAYLEGEDRPAVYDHAQQCPFCSGTLADLEQIRFASHHMPLEDPPARVWANIRAQLAQEGVIRDPARGWLRWFRLSALVPNPVPIAALAGLAIFGTSFLIYSRVFEVSLTPGRLPAQASVVTPRSVEESNVTRTLEEMERSYQASEETLDPAVKVVYQKSLKSLDTSIGECRDSVRREPTNDLAHEYLLTAYAQKAVVLASALEFEGR